MAVWEGLDRSDLRCSIFESRMSRFETLRELGGTAVLVAVSPNQPFWLQSSYETPLV
jgi:hypothetical protein